MSKHPAPTIDGRIDQAILGLNPLTGYGEDAVWRPADRARSALIEAREEIKRLRIEAAHEALKEALRLSDFRQHTSTNGRG